MPYRLAMPVPKPARQATVGLHAVTFDDDPALLGAVGTRLDGLVVAGFGVGPVPESLVDTLTTLAERIPVVLTSRTPAEPTLTHTYGFPGSEQDLIARGLIPAGWLHPYKARILLRALLSGEAKPQEVATAIATAGGFTEHTAWFLSMTRPAPGSAQLVVQDPAQIVLGGQVEVPGQPDGADLSRPVDVMPPDDLGLHGEHLQALGCAHAMPSTRA